MLYTALWIGWLADFDLLCLISGHYRRHNCRNWRRHRRQQLRAKPHSLRADNQDWPLPLPPVLPASLAVTSLRKKLTQAWSLLLTPGQLLRTGLLPALRAQPAAGLLEGLL